MHELDHIPATAGGPTMRGFLPGIRFHTDAGDGGGGGGDDAAGAGDAAALSGGDAAGVAGDALVDDQGAVVVPPVAAAATPVWHEDPAVLDLVDQRAQQLFEQQMGPLVPMLEQLLGGGDNAAGGGGGTTGELNPWDENFGGNLDARFQSLEQKIGGMLERVAAPLAAREQAELVQEGNQRLEDMLADDIARNGDFPVDPETKRSSAREAIRPLADMFFPAIAERFGPTPRAAEIAMQKATGLVRAIAAESAAAALASETNRLNTLAGAHGEAAVTTLGAQGLPEAQSLSEVTQRYAPLIRGN